MEPLMKPTLLASLLLVTAAACGDNLAAPPPKHHEPDAGGLTGIAKAVIVAGDFNVTGVISEMRVPQGVMHANVAAGIAGGDPFLRHIGDEVFVVNRSSGDNVTILDQALDLVQQISTGPGVNPQDVAVVGRRLYVPGLSTKGVVILDRDHPTARGLVDLSALDPDGKPDCVSAIAVGDRVFVACGLLDEHYQPRGNGKIAVVDAISDKVTGTFELPAKNPVGYLVEVPGLGGDLVIGTAPAFNDFTEGCLARVSTGATPAAHGCAVTNKLLAGVANHYEVSPDGASLWIDATGYNQDFSALSGKIAVLDLATLALAPSAMTPSTLIATDLAACPNGFAVVIDGTFGATGARVFSPDGVEYTAGAVDIGRAPGFGNGLVCY
jgi:DNA-binding beta-propeller fold protein YncE